MNLSIDVTQLPSVALDELDQLPNESGIYFACQDDEVFYVGKSTNINRRWQNHHRHKQLSGIDSLRIAWILFDKDTLTEMERHYITMFNPPVNYTPVGFLENKNWFTELQNMIYSDEHNVPFLVRLFVFIVLHSALLFSIGILYIFTKKEG